MGQTTVGIQNSNMVADFFIHSSQASITASVTQTQGQGALTCAINQISVCATENDTVTLPTIPGGASVVVINDGAETLQVFPVSGGNLGEGANASITINAGSRAVFTCYNQASQLIRVTAGRNREIDKVITLIDDGGYNLPTSSIGWGFVQVADSEEYAHFSWTSAAAVTLQYNSANVVNTDTDAKFCVYDSGSAYVQLKNRLGSAKEIHIKIFYKI